MCPHSPCWGMVQLSWCLSLTTGGSERGKCASRGVQDARVCFPRCGGALGASALPQAWVQTPEHPRRSRHRAGSTFPCGNHPPALTIPKPSPGSAGEAHRTIQSQVLAVTLPQKLCSGVSAQPAREAGGTRGDKDFAPGPAGSLGDAPHSLDVVPERHTQACTQQGTDLEW